MSRLLQYTARAFMATLLIGLGVGLDVNAASQTTTTPKYGGEYRAPLRVEPVTFDPALYSDIYSMQVAHNLFDGLVRFDENLRVVPAIAKLWKISRDSRTYTFILRQGVKFHNGREVTAEDFVYSFTRILDPEFKSPAASFFLNIRGADAYHEGKSKTVTGLSALQPYLLKIELEEAFAPFLSILAMINAKVVPEEAVGPEFGKHPVGTGPFRFDAWRPGKEVILSANEDYFDGRPYLDTLRFHIYKHEEYEPIFEDFQQGHVDHARIPSSQYDQILANPSDTAPYTILSNPGLNVVYVGISTTLAPLDDVRVRQALNYAVDTETIVHNITKRDSVPAQGILPPGLAGYDPDFQGYDYNPQRAHELLAEAGYPGGRGFPVLELWTASKAERIHRELQAYQRYFAEIGIEVQIRVAENWNAFMKVIKEKKAALFYVAWYADYPDADNFFYPLVHSKGGFNLMGFNDSEIDQMINQVRRETDYKRRVENYRRIEKLVMQQAPLISQHVNSNSYLFQPWIRNIALGRLDITYLSLRQVWVEPQELTSDEASVVNLAKQRR